MQLLNVYAWATDPALNSDLKKQLAAAIANAAVQILAELPTADRHLARMTWASQVLASPDAPLREADQMIWGILGNVTIQAELESTHAVPDGDLAFTVASLVNTYAT